MEKKYINLENVSGALKQVSFNTKLKCYRVCRNYSRKEVSEGINLSLSQISRIEENKQVARMSVLKKLSDFYGFENVSIFITYITNLI